MPLSWNEIRHNAIRFSNEWAGETREEAEGKSFWDEFFNVFGIRRRLVADFEAPVKNIRGKYGFIDPFWRGVTLNDLYDPLRVPPTLLKAHAELDRAVDLCYRREPFETERQRVEFLFALYEKLTAPLLPTTKPKRVKRRQNGIDSFQTAKLSKPCE